MDLSWFEMKLQRREYRVQHDRERRLLLPLLLRVNLVRAVGVPPRNEQHQDRNLRRRLDRVSRQLDAKDVVPVVQHVLLSLVDALVVVALLRCHGGSPARAEVRRPSAEEDSSAGWGGGAYSEE